MTEPYPHGAFCWSDLATVDLGAAERFYAELFGWSHRAAKAEADWVYAIASLPGGDVAGLYRIPTEQAAAGARPGWACYVAVEDVDAAAARAATLGGAVAAAPMDIPGVGRMASLVDREGAAFNVWARGSLYPGAAAVGPVHGAPCWRELAAVDLDVAEAFYRPLFGWGVRLEDMGGFTYLQWLVDHDPVGGALAIGPDWACDAAHWLTYFAVDDCDRSAQASERAGGGVIRPPFDIPEVGRAAVLRDPAGAAFATIALGASGCGS